MKKIIFMLSFLTFISTAHGITIYKWVDKDGGVHFTDDLTKVPPPYHNQVKKEVREDSKPEEPSVSPSIPSQKGEEKTSDIYGLGEDWWREKVRPWNEQLKEATHHLENVNKQIVEKSETISRKYWSPTQYKMNMVELDRLKKQRSKYQVKIEEANEMLKKISKEATDAKANPEWLK
jgi:hypothetical protein